jgi:glycine/D-amino acid oxidase-like deaminating enzyme
LAPGVAPSAVPAEGAIFNPQEGWVEVPELVSELARELTERGGEVHTHAGPCEITLRDGRVAGVRTGAGDELPCDSAVLATGSAVPAALAQIGVDVPDASTVALLVRTRPFGTALRAVLNTPRVSLRPTPEGGIVLDSGWSEREVVTREDGTHDVPPDTVPRLLAEAAAVLDGHPGLVCEAVGIGPKPIPGDEEPVLGKVDGVEGYHVAFTHSGATLGLIAGELVAAEVVDGRPHPLLDPFRPSRFRTTDVAAG